MSSRRNQKTSGADESSDEDMKNQSSPSRKAPRTKGSLHRQVEEFTDDYNTLVAHYKSIVDLKKDYHNASNREYKVKINGVKTTGTLSKNDLNHFDSAFLTELEDFYYKIYTTKLVKPRKPSANPRTGADSVFGKVSIYSDQLIAYYKAVNMGCGMNLGLAELASRKKGKLSKKELLVLSRLNCSTEKGRSKFWKGLESMGVSKADYAKACAVEEEKYLSNSLEGGKGTAERLSYSESNIDEMINPHSGLKPLLKGNMAIGVSTLTTIDSAIKNANFFDSKSGPKPFVPEFAATIGDIPMELSVGGKIPATLDASDFKGDSYGKYTLAEWGSTRSQTLFQHMPAYSEPKYQESKKEYKAEMKIFDARMAKVTKETKKSSMPKEPKAPHRSFEETSSGYIHDFNIMKHVQSIFAVNEKAWSEDQRKAVKKASSGAITAQIQYVKRMGFGYKSLTGKLKKGKGKAAARSRAASEASESSGEESQASASSRGSARKPARSEAGSPARSSKAGSPASKAEVEEDASSSSSSDSESEPEEEKAGKSKR